MNTILTTAIMLVLALIIAITILLISHQFFNLKKKEIQIKELLFYNEVYSDIESIESSIDTFIENIFNSYQIFHPHYFSKEFLSEDDQKAVIKEVHKEVSESISSGLRQRLLLIYSPTKIEEIINKKIFLLVISASNEINNTVYDNSDDIKKILNM